MNAQHFEWTKYTDKIEQTVFDSLRNKTVDLSSLQKVESDYFS